MKANDSSLLHPAEAGEKIEGLVATTNVASDGEYVAARQEGRRKLYCTAWRENGRWRRVSDWTEQAPESLLPHTEVVFAPQTNWGAHDHA